jgi:hypothetical protein
MEHAEFYNRDRRHLIVNSVDVFTLNADKLFVSSFIELYPQLASLPGADGEGGEWMEETRLKAVSLLEERLHIHLKVAVTLLLMVIYLTQRAQSF